MFTPDTNTSYLQHGENQKKRTNLRERGKEEEEEEEEEEIKKSNYPHNNHGKKCRLLAALYPHTMHPYAFQNHFHNLFAGHSQAILVSKLLRQMANAWNAEIGY